MHCQPYSCSQALEVKVETGQGKRQLLLNPRRIATMTFPGKQHLARKAVTHSPIEVT